MASFKFADDLCALFVEFSGDAFESIIFSCKSVSPVKSEVISRGTVISFFNFARGVSVTVKMTTDSNVKGFAKELSGGVSLSSEMFKGSCSGKILTERVPT